MANLLLGKRAGDLEGLESKGIAYFNVSKDSFASCTQLALHIGAAASTQSRLNHGEFRPKHTFRKALGDGCKAKGYLADFVVARTERRKCEKAIQKLEG